MRIYIQSCVDSLWSESEVSSCQGLRWSTELCSPRRQSQGHGVVTRSCLSGKSTLCDEKKRIHRTTIVKCYRRSKLLLLALPWHCSRRSQCTRPRYHTHSHNQHIRARSCSCRAKTRQSTFHSGYVKCRRRQGCKFLSSHSVLRVYH